MRDLSKLFNSILILLLVISVSCKDDDPQPANDFQVLSEYLVSNNMDLTDVLSGWITGAPAEAEVSNFITDNYIIDIRSQADYNSGHIQNAVNGSLGTILTDAANAGTKPIVVVCYTGQSAGHAVMALRLSGYSNAKVLAFGMSGWNSSFDKWTANTGDQGVNHQGWKNASLTTPAQFSEPAVTIDAVNAGEMLQERIQAMLSLGFQGVNASDVLASPANYFVNNFWDQADTDKYGHIQGAYRLKPLSLEDGDFNQLDPDKTIVTYCWTGQTSSMVTAYLTVLGYNAKSLKFGVNSMIYSQLEGHKFVSPSVDLPVVTE